MKQGQEYFKPGPVCIVVNHCSNHHLVQRCQLGQKVYVVELALIERSEEKFKSDVAKHESAGTDVFSLFVFRKRL
jgi:hypothetical protein